MDIVGTLAFGQKILGDHDTLLPKCFAPVEGFIVYTLDLFCQHRLMNRRYRK
jgi:hypothetical protein